MSVVKIRIDEVHELIISQSRQPKDRGYGYDTITEISITGPEGIYHDSLSEISCTHDLAKYIINYFGE